MFVSSSLPCAGTKSGQSNLAEDPPLRMHKVTAAIIALDGFGGGGVISISLTIPNTISSHLGRHHDSQFWRTKTEEAPSLPPDPSDGADVSGFTDATTAIKREGGDRERFQVQRERG